MGKDPRSRLLRKKLLPKPLCERFNLHKRWGEITLVVLSCRQTENLLWERSLNGTPSLHTPRLTFSSCEDGWGPSSASQILLLRTNKRMEQRQGKGLSPPRNISAQHSPPDPHLLSSLDKILPLIPIHRQKSGLIPIKSVNNRGINKWNQTVLQHQFQSFQLSVFTSAQWREDVPLEKQQLKL